MADVLTSDLATIDKNAGQNNFLPGMMNLGIFKQIGLMIGISASIAMGVYLALWGSKPDMRPLGVTDPASAMDIVSYLEQNNIQYQMDTSGHILVPSDDFQKVKMQIASQGILLGQENDMFLQKESGFGVSQRLESARLQRSRELTLAKTIESFSGVRAAKVHLAIPKSSAFLKDKRKPSASVLLNLYNNRPLDEEKVQAIVDLVSNSVANLESGKVTVTDQFGRLLHSGNQDAQSMEMSKELKVIKEHQLEYQQKISDILLPIVGDGNYTVQVNVDMDFTKTEQTQQVYNPDSQAVRNERIMESEMMGNGVSGVPGALSNQPPAASNIPEEITNPADAEVVSTPPVNRNSETEKRYDVDTTISHIRQQVGMIKKISVSVGLDYITAPAVADPNNAGGQNDEQTSKKVARSNEEIVNITQLIRGAIGFDRLRGDVIQVQSFDFVRPEPLPDPTPPAFYEQPLFNALWKPVVSLLLGLLVIFAILKPLMNKLSTPTEPLTGDLEKMSSDFNSDINGLNSSGDDTLALTSDQSSDVELPNLGETEQQTQAKMIASSDPTMVAQVVKGWVEEE